ncbi:MAG: YsnF/AvaK domain-containing protein, partial [Ktedonobacteraceae bacterium]
LVSVATSKRLPEATAILLNHDAYVPTAARASSGRMAQKEASYTPGQKEASYTPGQKEATYAAGQKEALYAGEQGQPGRLQDEQRMRLHAEQIQAFKQPTQVGEVILRKEVVTEQQTIDVPVSREEVVIERRSITGDVAASGEKLGENQTIRIPVNEERVDVTKRVITTGEVVVGKRERQEVQHFSDKVQHEEARWEQKGDAHIIWEKGTEQPPTQRGL